MDKNKEYSTIDLHHHSKYSFEAPKATLAVDDILEYYRLLAEVREKKVAFAICDHNSSLGGWVANKIIKKNPERYKNIEVIPGIEFSVSCGKVLTYPDHRNGDDKYVFKDMHLLAHAKKGKESEFFKRTKTISLLNLMVIDPATNVYDKTIIALSNEDKRTKYISIGGQILAARNLIANKYGIKIPYDEFNACIKHGASYGEIRNIFIDVCYNYMQQKTKIFKNWPERNAKLKISSVIKANPNLDGEYQPIFPKKPVVIKDLHGLNKIDILEIPQIVGDSATTCFAHPYTLCIRKDTPIAVKDFENVDISMLPESTQNLIKSKLNNPHYKNSFFVPHQILGRGKYGTKIVNDRANLVAFQILNNNLLKKGIKIDGFEITHHYDVVHSIPQVLDLVVDKYGLKPSFGTDDHSNETDEYFFKDIKGPLPDDKRQSYFSYHTMLATESSYFKLNRQGAQSLKEGETEITLLFK